jgi:hypothetical protein
VEVDVMRIAVRIALLVGVGLAALAAPGWAEEIQRWTDAKGGLHFTNTPSFAPADDIRPSAQGDMPVASHPIEPGGDAEAVPGIPQEPHPQEPQNTAADQDTAQFSTQASLRRTALERDLRDTQRQLKEIDDRLDELARARARHVQGSVSTGGVGTNPNVVSEEEHDLTKAREALADHASKVRNEGAQLRAELSTRVGSTPAWWTDVR